MAVLVTAIHAGGQLTILQNGLNPTAWMAGTNPAKTPLGRVYLSAIV